MNDDRELLLRYIDGTLEPEEKQRLETLLVKRPELAAELFRLSEEHTALRKFLSARRAAPPSRRFHRRWAFVGIAAAALLAAIVGIRSTRQPSPEPAAPSAVRDVAQKPPVPEKTAPAPSPEVPSVSPPGQAPVDIPKQEPRRPEEARPSPPPEKPPTAEPPPPAAPAKPVPPREAPKTRVVVARIERSSGEITGDCNGEKRRLQKGADVREDESLVIGNAAFATLVFGDQTRLELDADTVVRSIGPKGDIGKWVELERGTLSAQVSPQPKNSPLVIRTPQAEARVLGTTLSIIVHPDKGTLLEVTEGKVKLTTPENGRSLVVSSGYFAVAQQGVELLSKPIRQDARVDQAIRKGINFLRTAEEPEYPRVGTHVSDELLLLTFLHAGVPKTDGRLQELLKRMLESPLEYTYRVAVQAMVLEELDRVQYQKRIFHCAQFLVDNQCQRGNWTYGEPTVLGEPPQGAPTRNVRTGGAREFGPAATAAKPRILARIPVKKQKGILNDGDNSNTQYAALGLRACHEAGIDVPKETLELARRWWIDSQEPASMPLGKKAVASLPTDVVPRAWGYQAGKTSSSMTAGAIASVAIYDFILGLDWKREKCLQDGLSWLANPFCVREVIYDGKTWESTDSNNWALYYLYAIQRAGMLVGIDRIGKHDWYLEGARFILEWQKADGSWGAKGTYNQGPVWDTCFAILFLRKATRGFDVASEDRYIRK